MLANFEPRSRRLPFWVPESETVMIDALIAGKIFQNPIKRDGKNGNHFATTLVRVPVKDGDSMIVSVIAFDEAVMDGLLRLNEGDSISLSGELQPKVFIDKQGEPRPSCDFVAHGLLTAYAVKRKRGG